MFMNYLRTNIYAAGILTLLRIYLGWQWLTGGWEKLQVMNLLMHPDF